MIIQNRYTSPLIFSGLAISGAAILMAAIIIPTTRAIITISTAIANEEHDLAQRAALGETIHSARLMLTEVRSALPNLEASLIAPTDELGLVKRLETIASTLHLTEKIALVPQATPAETIPFTINLVGDFRSVGRYLNELERLPWYLTIDTVDIQSPSFPTSNPLNATIQITGYLTHRPTQSPSTP